MKSGHQTVIADLRGEIESALVSKATIPSRNPNIGKMSPRGGAFNDLKGRQGKPHDEQNDIRRKLETDPRRDQRQVESDG
jgi:hypothetical protein